jgi:hypothetical protein
MLPYHIFQNEGVPCTSPADRRLAFRIQRSAKSIQNEFVDGVWGSHCLVFFWFGISTNLPRSFHLLLTAAFVLLLHLYPIPAKATSAGHPPLFTPTACDRKVNCATYGSSLQYMKNTYTTS